MSKMISVASGFQYSVNINFDLNNDEKLRNFIPTQSALNLLEEILLSTNQVSADRARILIGAYGKGKSHIVLMILSILLKRDLMLFKKTMPTISDNPKLLQSLHNYYDSDNKILPIVISGSNNSLTQAFLLALQRTLSDNNMLDIMPETNYKAAIAVIDKWKEEFPETYEKFSIIIDGPISKFINRLLNYEIDAYEIFEKAYPKLTAGSIFNPFLNFDVVELYENVAKGLKSKGYTGVYVVYDEFSKFLETNIKNAAVSDMKMLQDFAEKCVRSAETQMHLMLISHKEISNYIDKLPKNKVDGWRGVSERFKHIHLNNNFSQTYEIISSVIQKEKNVWNNFNTEFQDNFNNIFQRYKSHRLFSGVANELKLAIFGCYPLHPVSTFILPRLSERVAQNERTLFTFLSAEGVATLPTFLNGYDDKQFSLITPDLIYDYFEPLLKKEVYDSNIHLTYVLTSSILAQLTEDGLESKIVKTISLIYLLGQFERLKPTKEEIIGIYSTLYNIETVERSITNLIDKEFVIYLRRSNEYLHLKKTSAIDVKQEIRDLIELQRGRVALKDTLNISNYDNHMYPSRYNDNREIIRYFTFEFIDSKEVKEDVNWNMKSENISGDGIIYGIIPQNIEEIGYLTEVLKKTSKGNKRYIFVVPRQYQEIESIINEYNAVSILRDKVINDQILFDEYEVIFEDLSEIVNAFIRSYTHPEEDKATYIHDGKVIKIYRKGRLTELMSSICEEVYRLTPVIANEAINRNEVTFIANNSISKIVTALLRNELEPNLGFVGTGQEVSIMRSTLIRTGVLTERNGIQQINQRTNDENMNNMLSTIETFILDAKRTEKVKFLDLYKNLTYPEYHIGLRKGLIPIYLAAVIHKYKQQIVITDRYGQVPINSDVIMQINANPGNFKLAYLNWSNEKEEYVHNLTQVFSEHVVAVEKDTSSYDYIANAIHRWYMSLPKYSKECIKTPDKKKINECYLKVTSAIKHNIGSFELLFKKIPEIFNCGEVSVDLASDINMYKKCYDNMLTHLKEFLIDEVKTLFVLPKSKDKVTQTSLTSTIKEWLDFLDVRIFEQLFMDGTDKCLNLFKAVTNDEGVFISRLANLATGLRIEDWNDETHLQFINVLKIYKQTAEDFHSQQKAIADINTSNYMVIFSNNDGTTITKRFNKVDISNRGKLLYNQIVSALEAMGQSITEQEKRQILTEILKELC